MHQVINVFACVIALLVGLMGFTTHDSVWLLSGIGILLLVIASK